MSQEWTCRHDYGPGSHGYCLRCGKESNRHRERRLRREARSPRTTSSPTSLYDMLLAKTGIDYEGNAE